MAAFAAEGFLISNHCYGIATDDTLPLWRFGSYTCTSVSWNEITKNAPHYLPFTPGCNAPSNLAAAPKAFDLDGDGQVLATTDGLMLLRVALGLTGDAVVVNATAPGTPRRTWAAVQPYLTQQCGLNVAP